MTRGEQVFRIYRDHHARPQYERRRRDRRRAGVRALAALAVVGRHVTELDEELDEDEDQQFQEILAAGLNRRPRETNAARAERLRETRRETRRQLASRYRPIMAERQFDTTSILSAVNIDTSFVNIDDIINFTRRN